MNTSNTMIELKKIKEQCSLEHLTRTPEERAREDERVIEWFESRLGRKIPVADHSWSVREAAEAELAQA
jgi:hypothetical protein